MFYIHGGSWRVGSAKDFKPHYLLDKDVVLVVIQYRLGPLGEQARYGLVGRWALPHLNLRGR